MAAKGIEVVDIENADFEYVALAYFHDSDLKGYHTFTERLDKKLNIVAIKSSGMVIVALRFAVRVSFGKK